MTREPRSRQDVIELLIEQHQQIRRLFDSVRAASGTDRDAAFAHLRGVLAHAGNEERDEFSRLSEELDPAQLRRMATAVRLAESVAPTRAHPGVELRGKYGHLLR